VKKNWGETKSFPLKFGNHHLIKPSTNFPMPKKEDKNKYLLMEPVAVGGVRNLFSISG